MAYRVSGVDAGRVELLQGREALRIRSDDLLDDGAAGVHELVRGDRASRAAVRRLAAVRALPLAAADEVDLGDEVVQVVPATARR